VRPGLVASVVGGPHVDTITGGQGVAFWFNSVEQHRYGVNVMATLHLHAAAGMSAHQVPLLYGPDLVLAMTTAANLRVSDSGTNTLAR
jgi:hypothetical protein